MSICRSAGEQLTGQTVLELLLIALMILINAFFAASEIAIVSARKARLQKMAVEQGNKAAKALLRLHNEPARFLATTQIGVTLTGFFASAIGAVTAVVLVADLLATVPAAWISDHASLIALVLVTLIIAFLTLVLGELVPKNLALRNSERVSLAVARPILWMASAMAPLVFSLTLSTNFCLRLLGSKERARVPSVSEDEIRAIVDVAEEEGVVDASEHDMIQGVFEFGDTCAREAMVPRVQVSAIAGDASPREAWEVIVGTGHSRVPVFRRDLDDITGILHAKDLLRHFGGGDVVATVQQLMRTAYFVPESKPIDDLLRELRQKRTHMAIVVDEYGGTAGVVTLEDLLERIIGPIQDEYDGSEVANVVKVSETEAIVNASAGLDEVNEALGINLAADAVDTIGGLVYSRLGRVPLPEEQVILDEATLTVLAVDGPRILTVRVEVSGSQPPGESEA